MLRGDEAGGPGLPVWVLRPRCPAVGAADGISNFAEKQGVCIGADGFSVFADGIRAGQWPLGRLCPVGCFTGDLPWNLSTGGHQVLEDRLLPDGGCAWLYGLFFVCCWH